MSLWEVGGPGQLSPGKGLTLMVMGRHQLKQWTQLLFGASRPLCLKHTGHRAPLSMSICTCLSFSLKASVTKHFQF